MMETIHGDSEQERAAEMHREAYNAAFDELGLSWHWDALVSSRLPAGPDGVRTYLEQEQPHLLRAYQADFLVQAIESAKARCLAAMSGHRAAHAGMHPAAQRVTSSRHSA